MTTANIGIRSGNVIVPYVSTTKRTKEYGLTTTWVSGGTSWTPTLATGVAYRDSTGKWRLVFNIVGTVGSSTAEQIISVTGVTFLSTEDQGISAGELGGTPSWGICVKNTSNLRSIAAAAGINGRYLSGDVALNAEPTWAAANMEGVVACDVYIPPANGATAGIIDGNAQTIAGNKTLTGFTALGNGNVALKCKRLTGTSPDTEGGSVNIAHGLTSSKIVTFNAMLRYSADGGMLPEFSAVVGYQYSVYLDNGTNFRVVNHVTNSESILSKAMEIVVWYIE